MNVKPDSDLPEESPLSVDGVSDAESKPVRRKRAVKAAVADDATTLAGEQESAASADDSSEPAKPVRKRRAAAEKTEEAPGVPAPEAVHAAAPQAASGDQLPAPNETLSEIGRASCRERV